MSIFLIYWQKYINFFGFVWCVHFHFIELLIILVLLSKEKKFLNIDPRCLKDVFSATADIILSHTKATLNVMHTKKNWITEYLKNDKRQIIWWTWDIQSTLLFFSFLYHNMSSSWQCTKMLHNWRKFQRVTGFQNTFSKQKQELKAYIFILRQ